MSNQVMGLETFLTVLEEGSMVRAAERLHVTQSTVTARLKALEAELGQTLVNRHKSGVTPTASGVRLQRNAETIVGLWRQARQETSLPHSVEAVCNMGAQPDLWIGLGATFFDRLRIEQPEVAISVTHGSSGVLREGLDDGWIDIAFTYAPVARKHQGVHPIGIDRLVLVSTEARAPVRFNPDYVFVEGGDDFGREHAIAYVDAWTARLSFGTAMLALDYLRTCGGSAYVPLRLVQDQLDSGQLFLLDAPTFDRRNFVVFNRDATDRWPWFETLCDITGLGTSM